MIFLKLVLLGVLLALTAALFGVFAAFLMSLRDL
jgi:hypothetical protein